MNDTTLTLFLQDAGVVHSIDELSRITHVPRHTIALYCRWGLIEPSGEPETSGWFFDHESIRTVRQIEYLRQERGVNLAGIRMVFDLLTEVEHLRDEVRFLRQR